MKNGVPKSNAYIINIEYSDALETLDGLPQSWNDFINASEMTDTDSKIQSAIWELVTTEVDYIYAIQTVTDVSRIFLQFILLFFYKHFINSVNMNIKQFYKWQPHKGCDFKFVIHFY